MHSHHHDHNHDHAHGHAHGNPHRRERRLLIAFALTTITMVAEAIGGWISGSLALLADAGHMLVDAGALMFAWLALLDCLFYLVAVFLVFVSLLS